MLWMERIRYLILVRFFPRFSFTIKKPFNRLDTLYSNSRHTVDI